MKPLTMNSIPFHIKGRKLVYNELSFGRFTGENEGKSGDLVIRVRPRSLSQLGMYRVWLSDVANHTGNDTEELHEFLLDKLAPRKVMSIHGKKGVVEIEKYKRTSGGHALSMNKTEMGEYMDSAARITEYPLPTREELEAMGYILNY